MIEWLNEYDEMNVRLGRYAPPLTEPMLLSALAGRKSAAVITLSTKGAKEYVEACRPRRVYHEAAPSTGFSDDGLVVQMVPGVEHKLEVSFALPDGFIAVSGHGR